MTEGTTLKVKVYNSDNHLVGEWGWKITDQLPVLVLAAVTEEAQEEVGKAVVFSPAAHKPIAMALIQTLEMLVEEEL